MLVDCRSWTSVPREHVLSDASHLSNSYFQESALATLSQRWGCSDCCVCVCVCDDELECVVP